MVERLANELKSVLEKRSDRDAVVTVLEKAAPRDKSLVSLRVVMSVSLVLS